MQTLLQPQKSDLQRLAKYRPLIEQHCSSSAPTLDESVGQYCQIHKNVSYYLWLKSGFQMKALGTELLPNREYRRYFLLENTSPTHRPFSSLLVMHSQDILDEDGAEYSTETLSFASLDEIPDSIWRKLKNDSHWWVRFSQCMDDLAETTFRNHHFVAGFVAALIFGILLPDGSVRANHQHMQNCLQASVAQQVCESILKN